MAYETCVVMLQLVFLTLLLPSPVNGWIAHTPVDEPGEIQEYCEWESFNATCTNADEVIMMRTAQYGRMRLGKCVTHNYGNVGCKTNVLQYMETQCSGQRSCVVNIIGLHEKRSCPKDFKSYLEASYVCMKVSTDDALHSCARPGSTLMTSASSSPDSTLTYNLTSERGYISSSVAIERGLQNSPCPWSIRVHPHQRLNISLLDFSRHALSSHSQGFPGSGGYPGGEGSSPYRVNPPGNSMTSSSRCRQQYALIVDLDASRNISVCAGYERETNVYVSLGSRLDIYLTLPHNSEKIAGQFLIKYEAIGCPPLEAPYKAWLQGDRDHAIVQCNDTDEAWFLTCRGTEWIGQLGNCTEIGAVGDPEWRISGTHRGKGSFPFGLLIVVALGVAIGVAVGLVMLVSVLAYMKRRRRRRVRSRSNYLLKNIGGGHDPNMELSKSTLGGTTLSGGGGGGGDRSPMLKRASSLGSTQTQRSVDYITNPTTTSAASHPQQQPATTWHLKRIDLPAGGGGGAMRGAPEFCPVHRSADDLDVATYIHSPLTVNCTSTNAGGGTIRSLHTTFKPRSALRDLFSSPPGGSDDSPKHHLHHHHGQQSTPAVSVTRYSCPGSAPGGHRLDDSSPYYFKLDPVTSAAANTSANHCSVAAENALNSLAENEHTGTGATELKPDVLPGATGCSECHEQAKVPNTVV